MQQQLRLYCLPYAGGSATIYRDWSQHLPGWVQVQAMHLPARGLRYALQPVHDWDELVAGLVDDIDPSDPRPLALFGHSMGALLALELAYELRCRYALQPVWLGVSACGAPSLRDEATSWLDCTDQELIAEMRRLNGTPRQLLEQHEWLELVLPAVRADFHLCGSYRYRQRPALASAISVFTGSDDELTQLPMSREAWRAETQGSFAQLDFTGDHFFIHTQQEKVIAAVAGELRRVLTCQASSLQTVEAAVGRYV